MGDGTVDPQNLSLLSAPPTSMPPVSDLSRHSTINPFHILRATHGLSDGVQGSEEPAGNDSDRPERQTTTDRPPREVTCARPPDHRESARDSRATNPTHSRRSRRSEDLPERLTSSEISSLRRMLNDCDRYSRRHRFYCQSIEDLSGRCHDLEDELREAREAIETIELAHRSATRNAGPNRSFHDTRRHHPYPEHERSTSRAARAPRREEPSRAANTQGVAREPPRISTTPSTPAVSEDVVMEPTGLATHGTQAIVPTTPAALVL